MKTDLTSITLVVDRSGSMMDIREDAQGGINSFLDEQAKQPGEALLTLVQFDTEYEFLHKAIPISEVPKYTLHPRGSTALLDAVGRAINETGERLRQMSEADRPGLVIFVVMTDGLENSSHEFTKSQLKEMIEHQQHEYRWQFTFLGANQDAFAEAGALGIHAGGTADYDSDYVAAAYAGSSKKVARMRRQLSTGDTIDNAFTAEERQAMIDTSRATDR